MTRSQTLTLLRILADKNGCEYIEPDDDVLNMLVQFAELVEDGCADRLKNSFVAMMKYRHWLFRSPSNAANSFPAVRHDG